MPQNMDEHTLRDMAVSLGVSRIKENWDQLALAINESRGHPGPPIWEGLIGLGERINELYDVTFTYEQRHIDDADR
jgi:hypothetical protein